MAVAALGAQYAPISNIQTGRSKLTAGSVVVAFKGLTDNSQIFISPADTGVTGFLTITARTAGTGFTIGSSVGGDAGFVEWMVINRNS